MVIKKVTVNLMTAILILSFNLIMFFVDGSHTIDRYVDLFIPTLGMIIILILKDKNIYPFYTIVGSMITMFGTYGNFSGVVFFYISANDKKTKNNIIINILTATISLCVKIYITKYYTAHIFSMIIAFVFIALHLYVRFWNTEINQEEAKAIGLTPEQIDTIKMLQRGYKHQEAAEILHIERNTFSARVSGLRKRFGVETDFQLAIILMKNNIISLNVLAKSKTEE